MDFESGVNPVCAILFAPLRDPIDLMRFKTVTEL
jgi:hypothetical protein